MAKTNEEKLAEIEMKMTQLKNRKKEITQAEKQKERKARTRRLIKIGAVVENALGFQVTDDMLPILELLIKGQEQRGSYFSKALKKTKKEEE